MSAADRPRLMYHALEEIPGEILHDELAIDAVLTRLEEIETEDWPVYMTAFAFSHRRLKAADIGIDDILADLLYSLDEEHGSEHVEPTEPTEAMTAAAKGFARVVASEYECGWYDRAPEHDVTIYVPDLIRSYRQSWIVRPPGKRFNDAMSKTFARNRRRVRAYLAKHPSKHDGLEEVDR